VSAGISAVGWAVIGGVTGGMVLGSMQSAPNIPTPPTPAPPPAASVAPDANNTLKSLGGAGQGGGAPGVAQTFLTGPGGVDQSNLLLGKTSLLGG
jgi:hypothetical protein